MADDFGRWQAPEMFVFGAGPERRIVQLGPLPSGPGTIMECLAIAFYKNGETIRTYTARDIVKNAQDPGATLTHYQVFGRRLGFRRAADSGRLEFDIEDYRGILLTFDVETGDLLQEGS